MDGCFDGSVALAWVLLHALLRRPLQIGRWPWLFCPAICLASLGRHQGVGISGCRLAAILGSTRKRACSKHTNVCRGRRSINNKNRHQRAKSMDAPHGFQRHRSTVGAPADKKSTRGRSPIHTIRDYMDDFPGSKQQGEMDGEDNNDENDGGGVAPAVALLSQSEFVRVRPRRTRACRVDYRPRVLGLNMRVCGRWVICLGSTRHTTRERVSPRVLVSYPFDDTTRHISNECMAVSKSAELYVAS